MCGTNPRWAVAAVGESDEFLFFDTTLMTDALFVQVLLQTRVRVTVNGGGIHAGWFRAGPGLAQAGTGGFRAGSELVQ